jgi:hypothetical protein
MKALIALVLLLAAFWVVKQLRSSYRSVELNPAAAEPGKPSQPGGPTSAPLPGLPASLESSLEAAQKQGATGLRNWLNTYRIYAKDPRLAAIELDYVVLLSHQDPVEAKRVFNEVKERISTSSPVHERVKRLEKSFQ